MKGCFGTNNDQSIFDYKTAESKLYTLLYKQDKGNDTVVYNNKKYNVLSFMTTNEMSGVDTIWNVCTPNEYRKRGFFTYMLQKFLLNTKRDVQLFVEDKALIPMYKKFGFIEKNEHENGYTVMFHSKYTI